MTAVVYIVRDWDKHFEVSQTRKVRGNLVWVATPTKHDGKGFRRIMQHKNGAAVYGAWCLILQVAAKCPIRGTLADDDGPLSTDDLESKTGCPAKVFDEAIQLLTSDRVRWLIAETKSTTVERGGISSTGVEWNGMDSTTVEHGGTTGQDITGQDRTLTLSESCGVPSTPPTLSLIDFPCSGKGQPVWWLTQAKADEYGESYPGVDVIAECRKARQWCIDNPTKRKTVSGMPAFLGRWLAKVQNHGGSNGATGRPAAATSREAERIERNIDAIAAFVAAESAEPDPMFGGGVRQGDGGTNGAKAYLGHDGASDTGVVRDAGAIPSENHQRSNTRTLFD